eukprot:GHVT01063835.1.p1 GENE.GHVT01063835.1~~GHVT01063835.1.p1  ORF type:complete len:166 (+),score=2.83 GHVT01063835.1:114-611(+)
MGAYKFLEELYKKKQSDVMRFLQRVRAWEYRHLPSVHRCRRPTRPDKAHRLGYKAKQGFVIYRVRVRRGDRKKNVAKGIVYGKPTHHGKLFLFKRTKRYQCGLSGVVFNKPIYLPIVLAQYAEGAQYIFFGEMALHFSELSVTSLFPAIGMIPWIFLRIFTKHTQ